MTRAGLKGRCFLELKSVLLEIGYIEKSPKFAYLQSTFLHLKIRVKRDRVYILINNNRHTEKGGGTAVLVKEGIPFTTRSDIAQFYEQELESTYIEITAKNGKHFIIGSLYRAPNTNPSRLIEHISEVNSQEKVRIRNERVNTRYGSQHGSTEK